ncbi:hypothetical protein [Rhizobium favelukesii]|uniref:hypothetical protein n=1 Tax=Rhizobium favelukesii TaxID=348824 RepID=UPI00215FFDF8|nr:hypothetical protein [Rhizobium favelukesii]MCS0459489.1 hypothetical protein [Rhizobium favelukesii]
MTDRPILFSGPMVRALLDGRKTQTRRLVADVPPQPDINCHPEKRQLSAAPYLDAYCSERKTSNNPRGMSVNWCWWQVDDRQCLPTFKVKAKPGDRLWVRETWSHTGDHVFSISDARRSPFGHAIYQADANPEYPHAKFWPSIHMPREFSRMTLTVTDVRVERLQGITEADAVAEGCKQYSSATKLSRPFNAEWKGIYREGYAELWNEINGAGAWESNPWVVAYTFTVHHGNIDRLSKEAA